MFNEQPHCFRDFIVINSMTKVTWKGKVLFHFTVHHEVKSEKELKAETEADAQDSAYWLAVYGH